MSGRAQSLLSGLLALVALLLGIAWWQHTYKRVAYRMPLPPTGEAAYNPLYALKRALQADGIPVQSRQRLQWALHPAAARDTLVLLGDPGTLGALEVDALLGWVEGGGHLVVSMPRAGLRSAGRPQPLLSTLDLQPRGERGGCERFVVQGEDGHVEFCGGQRVVPQGVDPQLAWGDFEQGFVFVRQARGEGVADVLASLEFMDNHNLDEVTHLVLARQLLDPNYGKGTVHLVYAADVPPLWRLLMERAWMAWLPLLLALAAWLWRRLQRVGPVLPSPPEARRSLIEHVQASGEHLRRYGQSATLHAAAREAFLARLRRRDPLAAALDGRARAEAIAARTGLPSREIEHALQTPRPHDGKDFRLRVARLIEMRQRL